MDITNIYRAGVSLGLILIAASHAVLFFKTQHIPTGIFALAWLSGAAFFIWRIDRRE